MFFPRKEVPAQESNLANGYLTFNYRLELVRSISSDTAGHVKYMGARTDEFLPNTLTSARVPGLMPFAVV